MQEGKNKGAEPPSPPKEFEKGMRVVKNCAKKAKQGLGGGAGERLSHATKRSEPRKVSGRSKGRLGKGPKGGGDGQQKQAWS